MRQYSSTLIRVLIVATLAAQAGAWEGHYMFTYAALRDWPGVSPEATIMPETLESFVQAEKNSLVAVLKDQEKWAQANVPNYPVLPAELAFDGKASPDRSLVKKFLMSLRVNPDLNFPNFVLYPQGVAHRIKNQFSAQELLLAPLPSLMALRADEPVLEKIAPHQGVSPLEILAAATEEPDHGLDIGLWQDNQTWFGPKMGMGLQPFGNPVLSYSSQAPLHMGFYHEKAVLYWAAPWLKRCYPEYRISQFLALARHAMATGHIYWGYRFLGWALHYIQDLTQPYHATLAPGVWWPKLIALNALEIIGIKKPAQDMRQLLTNRHLALENYGFESIRAVKNNQLLASALVETAWDQKYPAFNLKYPRLVVAAEGNAQANLVDSLLVEALPSLYVNDPAYIFTGTDPSINVREISLKSNGPAAKKLESEFFRLMKAFGSHTRITVGYLLRRP